MTNPAENAGGPLVIGISINAILLGVMSTQVYLYFTSFKNDRPWIKIFVAFLFLSDIINTVFNIVALYETFVQHFGDFDYLGKITWVFDTDPALTGIIVSSTQLFYAWRIYALTKSSKLALLIVIFALVGGVSALLTAVKIQDAPMFVLLFKVKVPIIIYLSAEVLGDIFITVSLVTYLTGFQQTDLLIDRIIRLTIQTGLFTAVMAAVDLLVYLLVPTGLHLAFNFPLCKLYSNSLMSTLNSRGVWMKSARDDLRSSNGPINFRSSTASTEQVHGTKPRLPSFIKPVMLSGHSKAPETEVYVNVESVELQDRHKNGLVVTPSSAEDGV